jgi:protein O-mannosyl-transferase
MKLSNDPKAGRVLLGIIVAGLVLFGASFNDPFHFDDVLITNDSNVTNPAHWNHFVNPLHLRELTFFSFYLNHLIVGDNPAGYHVVNVLLHIANAALLFLLLGQFFERWIAAGAAAVFLVHPVQTEPVLYIYQRSTLLACFFSLLALLTLSKGRKWTAVALFILAFESKESAIAVPLAVAAVGGARARQREASDNDRRGFRISTSSAVIDRRYRFGLIIGALVLAVITLAVLVYWGESTVGIVAASDISPVRYFMAQTRIFYTYLRLLFFPYPQSLEYEFPAAVGILPLVGIIVIIAGAIWLATTDRWRLPGLCILAFLLLLAPTSSIVPSADAAFEHRLYLPMLAFSVLAAVVLSKIPYRTQITAALLCILAVLTIQRGTVWATDTALWEDTVKHAPGKARVWFNLGGAYLQADPDKARSALTRALQLDPDFVEALYDIGTIEQRKRNWPAAIANYERAVEKRPDYWPAWNNMGNTLFAMGQSQRAVECFEKTLSLNPDYWPAQYNIAIAEFDNGRYEDALRKLKIVLDWSPEFREARYLMALSLTRTGHREQADEEWRKLGEIDAAESRFTPTMILAPNRP